MTRFAFSSWLRRTFAASPRAARPARRRLGVERLEARDVPSTLTVTSSADSGPGTLRDAIANAGPSGVIDFDPAVRTVDLATSLTISTNVTVQNDQGTGLVSLIEHGKNQPTLLITSGGVADLSGLVISHGDKPTYTNGVHTAFGQGIENHGTLTISDSELSGNDSGSYNPFIYLYPGYANDIPGPGGGMYNAGTATVIRCSVDYNFGFSGAAGIGNVGTLTVRDSSIFENISVQGYGGVAVFNSGVASLSNTTISDNWLGGGMGTGVVSTGSLALTECTVVGNAGYDDVITIAAQNPNRYYGPGDLYNLTYPTDGVVPSATINGCIIGHLVGDAVDPASAHNLIGQADAALADGVNGNQLGYDPGVAMLADTGDGREVCAVLPGSRAIGMGLTHTTAATDERGFARPVGTPADVGAFQHTALVVDTTADGPAPGLMTLRKAVLLASLNDTSTPEAITFDPGVFATAQTITLTQGPLVLGGPTLPSSFDLVGGVPLGDPRWRVTGILAPMSVTGPAAGLTISGGTQFTVFSIRSTATVTLADLTIAHGGSANAPGVGISSAGRLTLIDCTVTANPGAVGGGISTSFDTNLPYLDYTQVVLLGAAPALTLVDSTITGNAGPGVDIGPLRDLNLTALPVVQELRGSVTIGDCAISGNTGRGIQVNVAGSATVNGGSISGNGGGIDNAGSMVVTDCTITGNSATLGGGIWDTGDTALTDCTITGNSSGTNGGGILNSIAGSSRRQTGFLTVSRCLISGNSAAQAGGGLFCDAATPGAAWASFVYDSTFAGNTAQSGGGLYFACRGYDFTSIENANGAIVSGCTITGNSADGGGGLELAPAAYPMGTGYVDYYPSQLIVAGDILVGNVNRTSGAADDFFNKHRFSYAGESNQVFANNDLVGATAGRIDGYQGLDNTGFVPVNNGGFVDGRDGNQVGVSPAAVALAPLADNGGATPTFALLPGSIAIGAGPTLTTPTTDQRGRPRPVGSPSDAGAFELTRAAATVTVTPYSGVYDGQPHGLTGTGTGTGTQGEDLSGLLTLGDSFTAPGHHLVTWSFAGNDEYLPATGVATVDIAEVPGLVVNTTQDVVDAYDGVTSLREALAYADTLSGDPSITFDPAVFAAAAPRTITLNGTALPTITASLSIVGPGADRLTLDAAHQSGILVTDAGATVAVSGLTLADGAVAVGAAAVLSRGNLTLTGCELVGNSGHGPAGGAVADLNRQSSAAFVDCTFTANTATGLGGAVYAVGGMTMTLTDCTLTGNSAKDGGAIFSGAFLTLTDCTIVANTATAGTGGLANLRSATLSNTIVAGNTNAAGPSDLVNTFPSGTTSPTFGTYGSDNLIGTGGSGGLTDGTDGNQVGVANAGVAPLANNGGPVMTMALLPGSPAINAGDPTAAPPTDERGLARSDGRPDIGAFEQAVGITLPALPPLPVDTPAGMPLPAAGGTGPYHLALTAGTLPAGLTLTDAGLTGTPTDLGTFPITVTVTDANGFVGIQAYTVVVTGLPPAITTTANPAGFTVGQAGGFTVTATGLPVPALTASGALPDGVTFTDNGDGTATLAGTPAPGTAGDWTFTVTAHNVAGPDAVQTYTLTVNKAAATVAAAVSGPAVFGQAVTLTATVAAVAPGAGTPTGTVTFSDGATILGTATLTGGTAARTVSTLPVGTHHVRAAYAGDGNFTAAASGPVTEVVAKDTTTTVLAGSPAGPSVYDQFVTLTATVAADAPGGGTPAGTVTFRDGATVLATRALVGGVATLKTQALAVGDHAITATYAGSAGFAGSGSPAVAAPVVQDAVTVSVVSTAARPVFGQPVTVIATVAAAPPGAGLPAGDATFAVDGVTVGVIPLGPDGRARYTTSALATGAHTITVTYAGDADFLAGTGTFAQTVVPAATRAPLTTTANPAVVGQPVTLTAAVAVPAPGAGTPTGTITFLDGATVLATVPLSGLTATLTTAGLGAGRHSFTARYDGDPNFAPGSSAVLAQTVQKAATGTTLAVDVSPAVFGQVVTLTAGVAVTAPGAAPLTGTVTFKDGAAVLGTVPLSGGTASLTTGGLRVGTHALTATYNGDAGTAASTSAAVSQSVGQAGTTVALSSSLSPAYFSQAVTFTAAVAAVIPGAGAPTGTVTFFVDGMAVATRSVVGGAATLTLNRLAVGDCVVTAAYNGSTTFLTGKSDALTQTILPARADLAVTMSADQTSVAVGGLVTYTITVTNTGPSLSGGFTLTDAIPAGAAFVSASASGGAVGLSGGKVVGRAILLAGGSVTYAVVLRATVAGTLTTTATVSAAESDPDASNNSATLDVTVR